MSGLDAEDHQVLARIAAALEEARDKTYLQDTLQTGILAVARIADAITEGNRMRSRTPHDLVQVTVIATARVGDQPNGVQRGREARVTGHGWACERCFRLWLERPLTAEGCPGKDPVTLASLQSTFQR